MCDRGFHGSSSSSSTLGARDLSKGGTDPGTMQLKKRKAGQMSRFDSSRRQTGLHDPLLF